MVAVVGLSDDLDVFGALKREPQPFAEHRMIVDEDDPDHAVSRPLPLPARVVGSHTATMVPPPGRS